MYRTHLDNKPLSQNTPYKYQNPYYYKPYNNNKCLYLRYLIYKRRNI